MFFEFSDIYASFLLFFFSSVSFMSRFFQQNSDRRIKTNLQKSTLYCLCAKNFSFALQHRKITGFLKLFKKLHRIYFWFYSSPVKLVAYNSFSLILFLIHSQVHLSDGIVDCYCCYLFLIFCSTKLSLFYKFTLQTAYVIKILMNSSSPKVHLNYKLVAIIVLWLLIIIIIIVIASTVLLSQLLKMVITAALSLFSKDSFSGRKFDHKRYFKKYIVKRERLLFTFYFAERLTHFSAKHSSNWWPLLFQLNSLLYCKWR